MLYISSTKYILATMTVFDIAMFLCFGIAVSIVAALWLGE